MLNVFRNISPDIHYQTSANLSVSSSSVTTYRSDKGANSRKNEKMKITGRLSMLPSRYRMHRLCDLVLDVLDFDRSFVLFICSKYTAQTIEPTFIVCRQIMAWSRRDKFGEDGVGKHSACPRIREITVRLSAMARCSPCHRVQSCPSVGYLWWQ